MGSRCSRVKVSVHTMFSSLDCCNLIITFTLANDVLAAACPAPPSPPGPSKLMAHPVQGLCLLGCSDVQLQLIKSDSKRTVSIAWHCNSLMQGLCKAFARPWAYSFDAAVLWPCAMLEQG